MRLSMMKYARPDLHQADGSAHQATATALREEEEMEEVRRDIRDNARKDRAKIRRGKPHADYRVPKGASRSVGRMLCNDDDGNRSQFWSDIASKVRGGKTAGE